MAQRNVIRAVDGLIRIEEEKYIFDVIVPNHINSDENSDGHITKGFELFQKNFNRRDNYTPRLRRGDLYELCVLTKISLATVITELNAWFYAGFPDQIYPCTWATEEDSEMCEHLEALNPAQLSYMENLINRLMPDFSRNFIEFNSTKNKTHLVGYMKNKMLCRGGDDYLIRYGIRRRQSKDVKEDLNRTDTILLSCIPNLCRDFQLSPHWVFQHSSKFVILAKNPDVERVMDQFVVLSVSVKRMILSMVRNWEVINANK